MARFQPLHFLTEDNRLHTLVHIPHVKLCDINVCTECSLMSYCINHEYQGEDFCLCDAVAHKMGLEFEVGEDLFRFEHTEYDRSLQGQTINVMPRFKKAKRYIITPQYVR